MRSRLTAYAGVAAGAASLAVLFASPAPASARVAAPAARVAPASPARPSIVPYPAALASGHPLVLEADPRELVGSAWNNAQNSAGNCPANPSAVSRSRSGYAKLSTTGAAGNCTEIESPQAVATRPGYVYEADVYFSNFKDWPGFWATGNDWPAQGELDAVEPNYGVSYVTWHQAACDSSRSDSEISTNPWTYACKTTVQPVSANVGPGWHIVDIAWTGSGLKIYYDGRLYVTISESVTTGGTDPMRIIFSEGSCDSNGWDECATPADEGTPGNVQVKYVRVFS